MRYGWILLPSSLVTLLVAPLLAHGDETTDLTAAFEAEIGALNAPDLKTLSSCLVLGPQGEPGDEHIK